MAVHKCTGFLHINRIQKESASPGIFTNESAECIKTCELSGFKNTRKDSANMNPSCERGRSCTSRKVEVDTLENGKGEEFRVAV